MAIGCNGQPATLTMLRDEDAQLTAYVFVDLTTSDYGGYVSRAQNAQRQASPAAGLQP
jgi:hypothetical protein